jgi:hypothetical protein
MSDQRDAIQESCIARMQALGLDNPRQVWLRLGDTDAARNARCSYVHVNNYLTRKASMGSHKLQHVIRALGGDPAKLFR